MWMTWAEFKAQDKEVASSALDLLQTTLQRLIYGTALIMLLWFFAAGASSAELLVWRFWLVLAVFIAVIQLSTRLIPRAVLAANLLWLMGLLATNTLLILLLELPTAAFLYPVFPLLAVSTIGWPAGVVAVGTIAGLMGLLSQSPYATYLAPYQTAILAGSVMTGFVGWVTTNTLVNEVQSTFFYYRQARDHMEEARTHRAQLVRVLKDLDRAYYSLERANGSLVAAWRKAEDAEKFRAEFVTYVSHEMRTPLNLILGFSETILTAPESYGGHPLPGPYREDISKINRNAQHMMALINDVIDLSRADVNRIPMMRERIDIRTLVVQTVNMVRDYIQSKGLNLKVNVDKSTEALSIDVDALRIRQVLLNLLVNAARFTAEGGIQLKVEMKADDVVFRVIDSGQGIAPEDLSHIFKDYHSSDPQIASWYGSSGLGLPISKTLVELHGGRIGVESTFGAGAEFWFSLPTDDPTTEEQVQVARLRPSRPVMSKPPAPAIVMVQQDPRAIETMKRLMETYKILTAKTMEQACTLVAQEHAVAMIAPEFLEQDCCPDDLITVECALPGLQRIAHSLGVLHVLEKPVYPTELLAVIERIEPAVQRVLIVDDDVNLVDLFRRVLTPNFAAQDCLGTYSGEDALVILKREHPDLVLLDLALQDMDGREVVDAIQADPELRGTRIIVISGTVQDAASMQIKEKLRVSRQEGFSLGEAARAIEAMLTALTPGWHDS